MWNWNWQNGIDASLVKYFADVIKEMALSVVEDGLRSLIKKYSRMTMPFNVPSSYFIFFITALVRGRSF